MTQSTVKNVAHRFAERGLDQYGEEYDPQYQTRCLDEKPVVLHVDFRPPVAVSPGQPGRVVYEYEREGTWE